MPKLKINIDDRTLEIEVSCEYRARTYKKFIILALEQFIAFFNNMPKHNKSFVEQALFEIDIYEGLSNLLDETVLDFVASEIEQQQKHINWREKLKISSAEYARKLLVDYFDDFINDDEYLLNKYSKLNRLLQTLTTNFIKNMKLCLTRVIRHSGDLKEKFLQLNPSETFRLKRIISSDSDLHQEGKQVLILEFSKADDPNFLRKIVYKPFSIECDAWLVGNTSLLPSIGPSILEMLNEHLADKSLSTYLIYPCRCLEDGQHQKDYGFIEYLTHIPWPKYDLNKLAWDIAKKTPPRTRTNISDQLKNAVDKQFLTELERFYQQQKVAGLSCDFIIDADDQKAIERFSYQCGVLIALMYAFKVTDMHIQNLIVHGQLPYLIDLEFAFQPHVNSIIDIGCLDSETGAMQNDIRAQFRWRYLHDMSGLDGGTIFLPEKNCFFMRTDKGEFLPCHQNKEFLKKGFSDAMQIFHKFNQKFSNWLQESAVQDIKVRIIPFSTTSLRQYSDEINFIIKDEDTKAYLKSLKNSAMSAWLSDLKKENIGIGGSINTSIAYVCPRFAALRLLHIECDYNAKSLPAFYIVIGQKQLIDAHGQLIKINYEGVKKHPDYEKSVHGKILDALKLQGLQTDYFLETPLLETYNSIVLLANIETVKKIITSTNTFIDEYLSKESALSPADDLSEQQNEANIGSYPTNRCRVM